MTATGVLAKSSNMGTMLIGERVAAAVMEALLPQVRHRLEDAGRLPRRVRRPARRRRRTGCPRSATRSSSARATPSRPSSRPGSSRPSPTRASACRRRSSRAPSTTAAPSCPPRPRRPSGSSAEDTAAKLSRMMEEVTGENGTASAARIKGYRVAGKTGTADRYDEKLKGYNGFTASFIGYAPGRGPEVRRRASSSRSPAPACSVACSPDRSSTRS